jgi:hypothetical protein
MTAVVPCTAPAALKRHIWPGKAGPSRRSAPSALRREPPIHPMFSAGLPAILPELVQAVSASTVTTVATTAAGAEALLACERLEAMLVPSDGRLDFNGDDLNLS